ncbi:MAG: acetyl-CoA carboxylase biotin carboxylase subunit [Deltaproteobacteria bacterium]|nr:acetyl-CoA carboxylase biotin carboxylase subunit [Deltaproteobacteria bacterium]
MSAPSPNPAQIPAEAPSAPRCPPRRPIRRVLIANRGEIAVRVIRACHELGIETVAVYSEVDRKALHVRMATHARCIGPAPSRESYLRAEVVLAVARETGADAVHPGYGFLSENAVFAQQVIDAGLVWIGPQPFSIQAMGSKTESRARMAAAGVPVVPGTTEPLRDEAEAEQVAAAIGYPVMLKAAAGGGGKGMRRVMAADEMASAWRAARSEAQSSFADDAVYIEKLILEPRHVEVQVLADAHGSCVHLFERDCSIQRRNQKVVEETPCPVLSPETRAAMTAVAVQAAKAVAYEGAGTCEFLYGADGSFYFLEMNTRLQVEHPITELVTGFDLVQAQLRIAMGEPLWFTQDDLQQRGHAIELRVYAEDPTAGWAPSPGPVPSYREPTGPWVRVDGAVYAGSEVPIYYDPMVAKLAVWGVDRAAALQRAARALREYRVRGIKTSIPFFRALIQDPDFVSGHYSTAFLDPARMDRLIAAMPPAQPELAALVGAIAAYDRDLAKASQPSAAGAAGTSSAPSASPWKWSLR